MTEHPSPVTPQTNVALDDLRALIRKADHDRHSMMADLDAAIEWERREAADAARKEADTTQRRTVVAIERAIGKIKDYERFSTPIVDAEVILLAAKSRILDSLARPEQEEPLCRGTDNE